MQHALTIAYSGGFEKLAKDICRLKYILQAYFYDGFHCKMKADSIADMNRGRKKLSQALLNSSKYLAMVRDRVIYLAALSDPYPQGWGWIERIEYDGDIDIHLATELGDLRYDKLSEFLGFLIKGVQEMIGEVKKNGTREEDRYMTSIMQNLEAAKKEIDTAWRISKPFMKSDGSC